MKDYRNKFPYTILQVNTTDLKGGAAKSSWGLHKNYQKRGLNSWMAVGSKKSNDENVIIIPKEGRRNNFHKALNIFKYIAFKVCRKKQPREFINKIVKVVSAPKVAHKIWKGMENFNFPGTKDILNICSEKPDILHCRNLHGGYFDLRLLPYLSRKVPTIITLADAWLLSGHCAHSLNCMKWMTGCGNCPDISRYPPIRKDLTKLNWLRKQKIFRESKYYVTSASEWMISKVEKSILIEGAVDLRVIPNGIDLTCFKPREKEVVRKDLNIPSEPIVLLFAANGIKNNIHKNYTLLRKAIEILNSQKFKRKLYFVALGDNARSEKLDRVDLKFIPYQNEPELVAKYYQAADIYLHAAKAEVWGLTITEALGCGTPVVATDVGGIKEQIIDRETGFLTSPNDPNDMAEKTKSLIEDPEKRKNMGIQARNYASIKFDVNRMVDDYLNFYLEVINSAKLRE